MKKFFEKKAMDLKFRGSGQGHRLDEEKPKPRPLPNPGKLYIRRPTCTYVALRSVGFGKKGASLQSRPEQCEFSAFHQPILYTTCMYMYMYIQCTCNNVMHVANFTFLLRVLLLSSPVTERAAPSTSSQAAGAAALSRLEGGGREGREGGRRKRGVAEKGHAAGGRLSDAERDQVNGWGGCLN